MRASNMNRIFNLTTLICAAVLLASCNDDDEQVVPEVEAAQTILTAISPKGAGVVDQLVQACFISQVSSPYCGLQQDSTVHEQRLNANFIHDYTVQWTWEVGCADGVVDTVYVAFQNEGYCENPRLRSNDQSDGSLRISQFSGSFPYYSVGGEIFRVGNQQMKVRENLAFSSTITFKFEEVFIDKSTLEMAGGKMGVTMTGSRSGEGDFSYAGTLYFGNNKTATLVLNSGESYLGDW